MSAASQLSGWIDSDHCEMSTPRDRCLIYSGGDPAAPPPYRQNWKVAGYATGSDEFWKRPDGERSFVDYQRLAETRGGREFIGKLKAAKESSAISGKEEQQLWHEISRKYASQAEGNVTAYIDNAEAESVFRKTELPALLANPKVTSINGVSREELQQAEAKAGTHDPSHAAACEAIFGPQKARERELAENARRRAAFEKEYCGESISDEYMASRGRAAEATVERPKSNHPPSRAK